MSNADPRLLVPVRRKDGQAESLRVLPAFEELVELTDNEVSEGVLQLYAVLGVAPSCSDEELSQAYRTKIAQWHPDKLEGMATELPGFSRRDNCSLESNL